MLPLAPAPEPVAPPVGAASSAGKPAGESSAGQAAPVHGPGSPGVLAPVQRPQEMAPLWASLKAQHARGLITNGDVYSIKMPHRHLRLLKGDTRPKHDPMQLLAELETTDALDFDDLVLALAGALGQKMVLELDAGASEPPNATGPGDEDLSGLSAKQAKPVHQHIFFSVVMLRPTYIKSVHTDNKMGYRCGTDIVVSLHTCANVDFR